MGGEGAVPGHGPNIEPPLDVCVCLSVCVCPLTHLGNYMTDLHQISVHIACGHGSDLFWQCCDTLYTSGFVNDDAMRCYVLTVLVLSLQGDSKNRSLSIAITQIGNPETKLRIVTFRFVLGPTFQLFGLQLANEIIVCLYLHVTVVSF